MFIKNRKNLFSFFKNTFFLNIGHPNEKCDIFYLGHELVQLERHLLVPPKKLKFTPKRLTPKKLFGHQQNLTIPVNLIFNPNHKKLPKFSESII